MGSLLPGWDERAPGIAPKEFQELNEDEEDEGYFAAYAKMRKQQKEAGEVTSPIAISQRTASLTRRSQDAFRLSPSATLPRSFGRDWAPMSPPGARSMQRAETMLPAAPRSASQVPGTPPGLSLQRMYSMPMTRGERSDVLAGLVLPSPSALSSSAPRTPKSLDAYKTQHADKDKPDYQWWRHLDSAAMNERPDEPESKQKAFKPQFGATGQAMHYHSEPESHGPAVIPAH